MSCLFSLCIPTRNRSKYLKYAIQAALNQNFDDYEIVISDNNSKDNTREIVDSFKSSKIKYYKSERDISASDNFDRAAAKATGEYILVAADDEILVPNAFSSFKSVIDKTNTEVIRFAASSMYYFPGSVDINEGNYLRIRPFTDNIYYINSSDILKVLFNLDCFVGDKDFLLYANRGIPLGARTVIKRDLFNSIYKQLGSFHSPEPMYSSAVYLLNKLDRIVLYDKHFYIGCDLPDAKGRGGEFLKDPNKGWDKSTMDGFLKDFISPGTNPSIYTMGDYQTSGILVAQKYLSPDLDHYEINLSNHVSRVMRELLTYHANGIDVAKDISTLKSVMERHGIQDDFIYYFDKYRYVKPRYLLYYLKRKMQRFFASSDVRRQVWDRNYCGEDYGFSDILECLDKFEEISESLKDKTYAERLLRNVYPNCEPVLI